MTAAGSAVAKAGSLVGDSAMLDSKHSAPPRFLTLTSWLPTCPGRTLPKLNVVGATLISHEGGNIGVRAPPQPTSKVAMVQALAARPFQVQVMAES